MKVKGKNIPQINLFPLVSLSVLSLGLYFPLWYLRRFEYLGYNSLQFKFPLLNKWLFVIVFIVLLVTIPFRFWYGIQDRIVNNELRNAVQSELQSGDDILDAFTNNPGLFEKTQSIESNTRKVEQFAGLASLFLIIQSFFARASLNALLRDKKQKEISIMSWVVLGFLSNFVITLLSGTYMLGLLWFNFPMIILLQNKINRLQW